MSADDAFAPVRFKCDACGHSELDHANDHAPQWKPLPLPASPETGHSSPAPPAWPKMRPEALHGLAGEIVRTFEPETEADPVALLLTLLVGFGAAVGPGPHALVGATHHPARLNVVLVGDTSKARKGSAADLVRALFQEADPGFANERITTGLSSGEGLIAQVGDGQLDRTGKLQGQVLDKRLWVIEPEFARVLKVAGREGSTLSPVLRDAWDRGVLSVITKTPMTATGAHISVLAHITREELRRNLLDSEVMNGFANRFLFVRVKRSKLLPSGGSVDAGMCRDLGQRVAERLEGARDFTLLRRSDEAEKRWAEIYLELAEADPPGMLGAVVARAEAQTLRLSAVYALLDGSPVIDVPHLEAALAVSRFCAESAGQIFGDATGASRADRILAELRRVDPEGLTKDDQYHLFHRNAKKQDIDADVALLVSQGKAYTKEDKREGPGRRAVRLYLCHEGSEGARASNGALPPYSPEVGP